MSRINYATWRLRATFAPCIAAGIALSSAQLFAQQEQESTIEASTPTTKRADKIEVTGSRIKRTDVEGVTSLIVIDKQQIEKSGMSTVSEMLRSSPVSSFGSYSELRVNADEGTVTDVNLRGLGAGNTLVLLDGRRIPDEGGEGRVDLSTIPLAAVDRIEIVKDSSSALYGSDATGGVVNIITKKDIDASTVQAYVSAPQEKGGLETRLSYLSGSSNGRLRITTSLDYRHKEPIFHRDRSWTKEDGISSFSYPANYAVLGENPAWLAHPNCQQGDDERITLQGGALGCSYNYGATMAFTPETTQTSLLSNVDYEVNSNLNFFATLRGVRNTNTWNMAPNAGFFTINQANAAESASFLGLAEGDVDGDVLTRYRSVPWGLRTMEEEKNLFGAIAGFKGYVGADWEWSFSASRTESRKNLIYTGGYFLKTPLENAIAQGQFNVFDTNLDAAGLAVVNQTSYQPFEINESAMMAYNVDATGEMFALPGGSAALAVGMARTEQLYKETIDVQSQNDEVFGIDPTEGDQGERDVNSAYVELSLPLAKTFELQLAARHDVYSDYGSTSNPKVGFRYQPISELLVRGYAATGFKAPTLAQINGGNSFGLQDLRDPLNGNVTVTEVELASSGNRSLKEETSLSYGGGFIVEPINGLNLGVDAWYVKINDIVASPDPQAILDAEARGESLPQGVSVERLGGSTGAIKRVNLPLQNLSVSEDAGIDLRAQFAFSVGAHKVQLSSEYNRKFYARLSKYPGADQNNTLRETGKPAWRALNTVNYNISDHSVTLRQNMIGSHRSDTAQPGEDNYIKPYTTFDAQYAWFHPWNGSLAIGALNILDTDFPRDPNASLRGDDVRVANLYPLDRRILYMNLTQNF